MSTTASSFSIITTTTWSGNLFRVINSKNEVLFESDTRTPAIAAMTCLDNKVNYASIKDNKIRLNRGSYLMFNSLITKHRLGRPVNKEVLGMPRIPIGVSYLDMSNGLYISSEGAIHIYKHKTLDELFSSISKGS